MTQAKWFLRFAAAAVILGGAVTLSAFADDRPGARTYQSDVRVAQRGDISGIVTRVAGDGDDFSLRTSRGDVRIEAKGGVPVYYRGRTYRVRDLERGDRVAVDLRGNGRKLKARSVQVLSSASRGRYNDGWYGDRDNRRYDDRYRMQSVDGRVRSFDSRRGVMYVETSRRETIAVDVRYLDRYEGRDWARYLRPGDYVRLTGRWDGRMFQAERIDGSYDDRNRW